MQKVIFHLDMDAFFASCEQMVNPNFQNQPLVIAHQSRRSIITTSSYEARKFGVKTAMPLYQALALCPNLVVVEPHFSLYSHTSQRVWSLIRKKFTKRVELNSIDEAFLDVTAIVGKYGSPARMAQKIRESIKKEIGITCSIGISYTKFLAKMATDLNKPNGQTEIWPETLSTQLWPISLDKMQGVGLATHKLLVNELKIQTIGDLVRCDEERLLAAIGRNGSVLKKQALGLSSDLINPYLQKPKSISHEITLEIPLTNLEELEDLLFTLTQNNLIRLNRQQMVTQGVGVSLRYHWANEKKEVFDKLKHLKRQSRQLSLTQPTTNLETIFAALKECFEKLYLEGKPVILLGVTFHKLQENNYFHQLSLTENDCPSIQANVNQLLWDINHRLKSQKVYYGSHLDIQEGKYLKDYQEVKLNQEIRKEKRK
ncbi:DNA polymerase-4 [Entomoplasma freundtii]|uniref:DNA polymerase IV n=1 Tax=Entomoplasma freundtii TaxID=74700 RepID=A0A2K8NR59_9MOLU|nr:DNA polymerase IV [Entomoplasma freundtii]ATZ16335.1 DNA polymerase IV [Entomoplasma freundtii]TDY56626.1 DNA polymerase-4 [Entomoplasma freundtii]